MQPERTSWEVNSLIVRGLFKNKCNNVIPLRYQSHLESNGYLLL